MNKYLKNIVRITSVLLITFNITSLMGMDPWKKIIKLQGKPVQLRSFLEKIHPDQNSEYLEKINTEIEKLDNEISNLTNLRENKKIPLTQKQKEDINTNIATLTSNIDTLITTKEIISEIYNINKNKESHHKMIASKFEQIINNGTLQEFEKSIKMLEPLEIDTIKRKLDNKKEQLKTNEKNLAKLKSLTLPEKENRDLKLAKLKSNINRLENLEKIANKVSNQKMSEGLILDGFYTHLRGLRKKHLKKWKQFKKQFIANLSPTLTQEQKKIIKKLLDLEPNIFDSPNEKEKNIFIGILAFGNNASPFDEYLGETGTNIKEPVPHKPVLYKNLFSVSQKPSLSQRRRIDEQTNLCGYYALFNAATAESIPTIDDIIKTFVGPAHAKIYKSSLHKHPRFRKIHEASKSAFLNRTLFAKMFSKMLINIAKERGLKYPYHINDFDNLSNEEIIKILQSFNLLDKVLLVDANFMSAIESGIPLTELAAFGVNPSQVKLFKDFKSKETNNLVIVYLVPGGANHYIAIQVKRTQTPKNKNFLEFTIYDSIGKNYVDPKSDIREYRILPLYNFLTK